MEDVTLGIALIAGLLSFLSPCVLPLVPAYISYMGGRAVHQVAISGGTAKQKRGLRSRLSILIHGMTFVLGFTFVFVTLGIATTAFVQLLGTSAAVITEIIARLGGVIIVFFGLHFMGALRTFFAWLRANPDYLRAFPSLLLLIGLFLIAAIWASTYAVITWQVTNLLVRAAVLVIALIVLQYLLTRGLLKGVGPFLYRHREALGTLPTTIVVAVLVSALIIWGFVEPVIAIPVAAVFVLVLFVMRAFDDAQAFWLTAITRLESLLYADTRAEVDPTASSSLGGSFVMGVTFAAGWTPCIGPIYGAILQLGIQGEVFAATPLLLMYSLGLGIPFLITAGLLDGAQVILRRIQRYMGKIELFTGFLLIFVGILVASGQLQSLSQNLSPEQTEFSINIEECGTSVAQGHISLGQFGACMNGNLHPVAIGQGVSDTFSDAIGEFTYVLLLEEAETIDVDVSRIDGLFPATVAVFDPSGSEIASSSDIVAVDERTYRVLEDVELDAAGRYTVTATRNDGQVDEFQFRLTIRRDADDVAPATETGAVGMNSVGTIENLAATSAIAVGLDTGDRAPNFEVETIEGDTVSLADLRGQVVLINFWGTWCGPCIREMPDLQAVYDDYRDQGFTILALATRGDTVADVQEFRENLDVELTFPLIVDEGDVVNDQYGIVSRPSTFILDQDGVIVFRHFGPVVESQIAEVLDSLAAG